MVFDRFERFTFFKPPAMPEVYDVCLAWRTGRASGGDAGSHKTPTVTGRKGNADKARAVSRNGASGGSMRQNLCT